MLMVLIVGVISLLMVGCSASTKVYEENIEQGLEQIERDEFTEAEASFKVALEEKPEDDQGNLLIKQVQDFQQAQKELDSGDLEAATEWIEKVIKVEDASDLLVKKGIKMQEQMEELKSDKEAFLVSYETAKKQLEDQTFDDSIKTLEDVLQRDFSHAFNADLKKDIEALKEEVIVAQEQKIENDKAEEERKAAELEAEKVRKEEEDKKKASKDVGAFKGYWLKDTMACHFTNGYIACALANSDFITYDKITAINHISSSQIEITFDGGVKSTLDLIDQDSLKLADGVYSRVSEEEANAIYDGYYELP